jgi:hypothetical protein
VVAEAVSVVVKASAVAAVLAGGAGAAADGGAADRSSSNPSKGSGGMKDGKMTGVLLLVALCAPLMAGCGPSLHARSVDLSDSFLVNPKILQKGSGNQALYRYQNPDADVPKYTKIIVDPVLIYNEAQMDAATRKNYQALANNGYAYIVQALQNDYTIVTNPGPDTMNLQFGIVSADKSAVVRNLISTVLPVGMAISAVKYEVTGKPSAVGEVTAEVRITDSQTGQLIGAALDRRVGGKELRGVLDSWETADAALKYWAQRIRYILCVSRGGMFCVKPDTGIFGNPQ